MQAWGHCHPHQEGEGGNNEDDDENFDFRHFSTNYQSLSRITFAYFTFASLAQIQFLSTHTHRDISNTNFCLLILGTTAVGCNVSNCLCVTVTVYLVVAHVHMFNTHLTY